MEIIREKILSRYLSITIALLILSQMAAYGNEFTHYFKLTKTIRLDPGDIVINHFYPVFADSKGNFIACDYRIGKVLMFDNDGNFIRVIADNGRGPGEVVEPFAGAMGSDDQFAIIDNATRRVSLYNPDKKFTGAFYLNSRTQPGGAGVIYNNYIYMPTKVLPGNENGTVDFIAKYDNQGRFVGSFFPKDDRLEGIAGNTFSKLVINDNQIFAIQTSLFEVSVMDTSGQLLRKFGKKPTYFVSPTDLHLTLDEINSMEIGNRQKIYREMHDILTPVVGFFTTQDKLFITSNIEHGEIEERKDKMEVYDLNGAHIAGDIDLNNTYFLTKGNDGYVYFVIGKEINETNTYYLIGQYQYVGD